jgi:hypothetical protein
MSEEMPSQKKRSLPLVVKAAVFLAVLVVGLLPFVSTGTVANWAAVAFVALIVVVGVIGLVAEMVGIGRDAGRGGGAGFGRRLVGIAVPVALLILSLWGAFSDRGSDRTGAQDRAIPAQQEQKIQQTLRHCETAKACVQRLLDEGKSSRNPSNKPSGLRE